MFNHIISSCSPKFCEENFSQYCTHDQNEFQTKQFTFYSESEQYSGDHDHGKTALIREESEAVDELLKILVECLNEADIRTREVLLRKCFFEIEKEIPLERFLAERIKYSRVKVLSDMMQKIQRCSQDCGRFPDCRNIIAKNTETYSVSATRELVELSSGEENSEKMERFKVKTVKIGEIVKEEPRS